MIIKIDQGDGAQAEDHRYFLAEFLGRGDIPFCRRNDYTKDQLADFADKQSLLISNLHKAIVALLLEKSTV